ncbi:peptidoglycan editing factor PgeF [Mesorhizobium camelthorni]|uniref:Purine nucleoside phosphorylase n=2 Tax=Allomesorhizobium camelthorni TaxID=475069 RepID=A0A6G4WIG0_9HYPH|nr:peptidoglycan editing factor PgeF [Mesorhizobium camelthorni]NGO54394.1 peptidoglycan editing factor PgeF [Mesorhizobium camelthorni]
MRTDSKPEPLRSPLLAKAEAQGIRHGFFTRVGGVSEGIYQGLNIGVGSKDDPALVRENRRRVAEWMGVAPDSLLSVYQVHSPDVIVATGPFPGPRPQADAIVTDRPGLALGASSADCGPVLFADAEARVIGAAHAGWKGALAGVLENTIDAMEKLGAVRERIVAVLGPSIGPENYEVGAEFVARFTDADRENERYFRPSHNGGHSMFDLNRYTLDRLRKAGVLAESLDRCTYAEETFFYSYRRTTHRREADYGRQISAIVLEEI